MLLEVDRNLSMSISATTRPIRPGEIADEDYHFVSDAEFDRLVADDSFAEWAHVFDYRYGTPKEPIKAALRAGRDVLFDVDWQGAEQLSVGLGEELVTIFILPPSMQELERRLHARATDSEAVIAGRMARAANEIGHWAEYDYVLINDDTQKCLAEVRAIVGGQRLLRRRQLGLVQFVRDLVSQPN